MPLYSHAIAAASCALARPGDVAPVELLTRLLLDRTRLAVIYGGDKAVDGAVIRGSTNPRSWKSYEAAAHDIAQAMRRLGCRDIVVLPDVKAGTASGAAAASPGSPTQPADSASFQ